MVIPLGAGKDQEMILLTKGMDGSVTKQSFGMFQFVPMLKETSR